MDLPLVVIVVIFGVTAAVLWFGTAIIFRAFKASTAPAPMPEGEGYDAGEAGEAHARYDRATTQALKRFFHDKACAICKRPIPPVQRVGLKPGLLNPDTHQVYAWDRIPSVDVSSTLETHLPVCSDCQLAESFRKRFPDRVVDRDRSVHDQHPADRVGADS